MRLRDSDSGPLSVRGISRVVRKDKEGVGVEAPRDTTPAASARLPYEPPFENRASPNERGCNPVRPPSFLLDEPSVSR